MAIQTSNLGYPRIGLQREWKKTLEAFWSNKIDEEQFFNNNERNSPSTRKSTARKRD
ncbi:hypothetical protein ACT7DG_12510 [Bacillus cereus]